MGYRITYDAVKIPRVKRGTSRGWAAGILVALLVAGAVTVKAVGLPWVQEVLLPGDPAVTAAALEGMVEDLKEGDSLAEAVTAFCREIVENGQ